MSLRSKLAIAAISQSVSSIRTSTKTSQGRQLIYYRVRIWWGCLMVRRVQTWTKNCHPWYRGSNRIVVKTIIATIDPSFGWIDWLLSIRIDSKPAATFSFTWNIQRLSFRSNRLTRNSAFCFSSIFYFCKKYLFCISAFSRIHKPFAVDPTIY